MIDPRRSFDRAASDYEAARPSYPDALLDVVPLDPHATVLDLGAGTGKLTRVLARRYERVIAVEPLDGMRAILEAVVPEAQAHAGLAEAIPLGDASVDAVFAGQAFHWFSNDESVGEITRVLRSGGVLAIVWNDSGDDRLSPLPEAYVSYFDELHAPSLARVQSGEPVSELLARGPFGELHEASVPHEQVQSRDEVLAFARSMSWIAHRPDGERAAILERLGELLPPGSYAFPLCAHLHWAVRT